MAERCRVSRVVERLNATLADTARLEAVRWEERFYAAHDGFQPQIPRSGECDIVLAVLRGRIGSPLSAAFHEALPPEEQLPDGQSYASGTAYEIVSAIRARQEARYGESPDVYIFRWPNPPQVSLDAPDRAETEAQWTALKRFADEVFLTAEGQFKGAYQTYASLDDFEAQTEALLRDWLKRHVLGDRTVLWPAERGSPFRGLQPFGMAHASVFFGRSNKIVRAVERLKVSAAAGKPFQVVIGPSGAGKSSFLRAGLLPRLLSPGEVEEVGEWRVALMRPGDSPDGPVAALARCLFEPASAIDPAEAGRPEALPELAHGAFGTPELLVRQLAHADETSAAPILAALDRVAAAGRARWSSERPEAARLLLAVDQIDEVFATTISDEQRATFARLLEVLARSGAVWIIVTLRAEFYEVFLKSPLAVLSNDERSFTLEPPGLAELSEIVREPAKAAGLEWETDLKTGERLDERLLADIDRPDLLPLLEFVLDRLYEKREGGSGQTRRLTFAAYRAIGTLDGAIRAEAERAFSCLAPAEQAALPRLLRGLVVPAQANAVAIAARGLAIEGTLAFTLSPAALDDVAPTAAGRRLAAALVDARLLVSGRAADGTASVGLAHQRVIEAWDRARLIVAKSAAFHRVRAGLAARRRDWEEAKRPNDLLLPRGVLLAQAQEMAASFGDEIDSADQSYIRASRRHAERALRRAYLLIGLFALVAVGAVATGVLAYNQREQAETQRQIAEGERNRAEVERERAETNFTLARETVDRVVSDVAQGLRQVEGMRIATLTRILARVEAAMHELTQSAPDEPRIQRSRAAMLVEFGKTYQATGDGSAASKAYQQAIDIDRSLLQRNPNDAQLRRNFIISLNELGKLKRRAGNLPSAAIDFTESLSAARRLFQSDIENLDWWNVLSVSLSNLGGVMLQMGDTEAALVAFEEVLSLRRQLARRWPDNLVWQFNLSENLNGFGDVKLQAGDSRAAQSAYQQSLAITRFLVQRDAADTGWQNELAASLQRLGDVKVRIGDLQGALAAFGEALEIHRTLVRHDPGNATWQRNLSVSLQDFGVATGLKGDDRAARPAFDEALRLRRALVKRDPANTQWQGDLWRSLITIGERNFQEDTNTSAASAAYDEAFGIAQAQVDRDPENTQWQRRLAVSYRKRGDTVIRSANALSAMSDYKTSSVISRALVELDRDNAVWQSDLAASLDKLGDASVHAGDSVAARAAFDEALRLRTMLSRRDPDNVQWQHDSTSSRKKVEALLAHTKIEAR